ncbi:MAG TPA: T9SS type A sorting domain-containing protein [Ignavibacteria bacterium]|nr:T9SS type A sorting domain-containing protein [Ignavibacteria bacterium]
MSKPYVGSFILCIKYIDGKTVYARKLFNQNDPNLIKVNNLSPGIYIVIVTKEEQTYRKIIIVR